MKPEGRALDIAVIGLGQAGGNLASEFFRRGYRALAFNTAQTDLSALEPGGVYPALPSERRIYIGLDGYDGAGADPSYGRECVSEHAERIRSAVMKQASSADVVVVAAGLGGGTGSAIGELINVLKGEDLPLLALMTLPTEGESGIAKVNAVRAINEIVDAQLLGWIFVDNSRIAALHPDVSVVDYYAHINGQIASPLDALNRLNDRDNLKAIRSFDGEDFRKLLLSGGVLNYGVAELPSITTEEVVGSVRDCVEASELMPSGFDMGRLSYLGLVIEANEAILAATPISVFEEIHEQLKTETEGAAVYHGIYRCSDDLPPTMRLICATQSLPNRVRQVLADAKREGQALGEKIREQLPTLELGEIEGFELFKTSARNRASDRPRRSHGARPPQLLDELAALDRVERPGEQTTEQGVLRRDLMGEPRPSNPPRGRAPERRPMRPREPPPPPQPSQRPPAQARDAQARPAAIAEKADPAGSGGARAPQSPAQKRATPAAEDDEIDQAFAERFSDVPDLGTEQIHLSGDLAMAVGGRYEAKATDVEAKPRRRPPPPPPSEPTTGEMPTPEAYDRLVAEFRTARDQAGRDQVARRLEADFGSPETAVRYYAIDAMAKIGRDLFGSALLAATEDESEAVRALAVEALRR